MLVVRVAEAIDELRQQFGSSAVTYEEDGSGGAYATISGIDLPTPYNSPTWMSFQIPYTYPAAEVYPVFVRADLRADEYKNEALRQATWRSTPATQISLKIINNRRDAELESVALKVLKVIAWLKDPK